MDYWTSSKLYQRQERQNKHFRWTADNITKFNELNKYLTQLMEEVYSDCLTLKEKHDKWIAEGKDYYRNYEITGGITVIESDSDKFSARKNSFKEEQDYYTNDEEWCIRFSDSGFCKSQLSKKEQMNNFKYWESDFAKMLKDKGVAEPCAYLEAFLDSNHTYSFYDFVRMKPENFCKYEEVKYE